MKYAWGDFWLRMGNLWGKMIVLTFLARRYVWVNEVSFSCHWWWKLECKHIGYYGCQELVSRKRKQTEEKGSQKWMEANTEISFMAFWSVYQCEVGFFFFWEIHHQSTLIVTDICCRYPNQQTNVSMLMNRRGSGCELLRNVWDDQWELASV